MPAVSRLTDITIGTCSHGLPCCPHTCVGVRVTGSPNTNVNGLAVSRVTDIAVHTCFSPDSFLFVNGEFKTFKEVNVDDEVITPNGEIGIIYAITRTDICIRFIHKEVRLPIDEAHMIMPAYAITVHKSQGSEYGVVIIPFVPRYGGMLQRNLLYTAVTRAKRKVIIVGTTSAVERAVRTVNADERYTLFKERLQGRCDS